MSAPNFITVYMIDDNGFYQLVDSELDHLKEVMQDYFVKDHDGMVVFKQINGADIWIRLSRIEAFTLSTEDTRDNMYRLEQMSKQEKMSRGDFNE
jgi:hypothetical protein